MTISLSDELARRVEAKLAEGRYRSSSELVDDALRLMEDVDRANAIKLEDLRDAFQQGIDSGPATAIDFQALKAEGRQRLADRDP